SPSPQPPLYEALSLRLFASADQEKLCTPTRTKDGAAGSLEASSTISLPCATKASIAPDGPHTIEETPSATFRGAPGAVASHSSPSPARNRHAASSASHSPPVENDHAPGRVGTPPPTRSAGRSPEVGASCRSPTSRSAGMLRSPGCAAPCRKATRPPPGATVRSRASPDANRLPGVPLVQDPKANAQARIARQARCG